MPHPRAPRPAGALLRYASPLHPANSPDGPSDALCDGTTLIVLEGITLPQRCVLCGDPSARGSIRLSFTWDSSFHLTRQSSLQLRRKAIIHAYLCALHRARWARGRLGGIAGMALSVAIMVLGIAIATISENSDIPLYTPLGVSVTIAGFAGMILFLFFLHPCHPHTCLQPHPGRLPLSAGGGPRLP